MIRGKDCDLPHRHTVHTHAHKRDIHTHKNDEGICQSSCYVTPIYTKYLCFQKHHCVTNCATLNPFLPTGKCLFAFCLAIFCGHILPFFCLYISPNFTLSYYLIFFWDCSVKDSLSSRVYKLSSRSLPLPLSSSSPESAPRGENSR